MNEDSLCARCPSWLTCLPRPFEQPGVFAVSVQLEKRAGQPGWWVTLGLRGPDVLSLIRREICAPDAFFRLERINQAQGAPGLASALWWSHPVRTCVFVTFRLPWQAVRPEDCPLVRRLTRETR